MRILIAALTGAVVVFIWSAIAHMATPLGTAGMSPINDEDPLLDQMRKSLPASSVYFFPTAGLDFTARPTPEQMKMFEEKMKRGPSGLIIYTASGGQPMSARQLVSEFVANFLAAAIAAILLSAMAVPYFARAVFVALLALFAFLSTAVSHWIWYGFPTAFIVAELIGEFVGWFLAGLAMAKIVKS
jgi:hypothetical protein